MADPPETWPLWLVEALALVWPAETDVLVEADPLAPVCAGERAAVGDQASISGRIQIPLSKSVLVRTDIVYGALQNALWHGLNPSCDCGYLAG